MLLYIACHQHFRNLKPATRLVNTPDAGLHSLVTEYLRLQQHDVKNNYVRNVNSFGETGHVLSLLCCLPFPMGYKAGETVLCRRQYFVAKVPLFCIVVVGSCDIEQS
jgi:hypothetical protein